MAQYVIDSNIFIDLKHYFPDVFPALWEKLNWLVEQGTVVSVKEVLGEISGRDDFISDWASSFRHIFHEPDAAEYEIVKTIVSQHPELLPAQNISGGKPIADPFIIAKAVKENLTVVTNEKYSKNAHRIPNVCEQFGVKVFGMHEFFLSQGWKF